MKGDSHCRYFVGKDSIEFRNPSFDDSQWDVGDKISVGAGSKNIVWFRCYVALPKLGKKHGLMLDLGRVADEDQTYVNGIEVGNTQMVPEGEWPIFYHRNYFVNPQLIQGNQENILVAVRASSRSFGTVGFLDHIPEFQNSWVHNYSYLYEVLPFGFVIIFLFFMRLYPFSTALSKLKLQRLSQMGASIACVILLNTFLQYRYMFPYANIWLRVHMILTAIASFLIFRFIDVVIKLEWLNWVRYWTFILSILACFIPGYNNSDWSSYWIARLFGIWGIPIILAGIFSLFVGFKKYFQNASPALLSLATGGFLLVFLGGWDISQLLIGKLPVALRASEIGFLCFFVGAIFYTIASDHECAVEVVRSEYEGYAEVVSLASQVAHDIRSPLTALELIAQDSDSLPEKKRVLIRSAIGRITDIANELIYVGKGSQRESLFDSHQIHHPCSKAEVVLLSGVIDSILTEKRIQYRSRVQVEIESDLSTENYGLFVRIDPKALGRVLSNLIDNSVDAISHAGRVRVTISKYDDQYVSIVVEDNGIGILQENKQNLGKKGFTFGKKNGSGLGLYHANQIVMAYSGKLDVHSEQGIGTRVSILLKKENPPSWFVSKINLHWGGKVVILDDDPTIHQVWEARIVSAIADQADIEIFHFSRTDSFKTWYGSLDSMLGMIFLIDYELIGSDQTGLDVIRELKIESQSILVTSRFEDPFVFEESNGLGVSLIPKGLAGFVPIVLKSEKLANQIQAVLLDDDLIIRETWSIWAEKAGVSLRVAAHEKEFLALIPDLGNETQFYIDYQLKGERSGNGVIKDLLKMGFKHLHLTTGFSPEVIEKIEGVKIIGKQCPWRPQEQGESKKSELRMSL